MTAEIALPQRMNMVMDRLRTGMHNLAERTPMNQRARAEFTTDMRDFLNRCGINADHIRATPLGHGANHVIFPYSPPGEQAKVVKVPQTSSIRTLTGSAEKATQVNNKIREAFGRYYTPAEICADGTTGRYCVVQDRIRGSHLTHRMRKYPTVMKQLAEIAEINRRLVAEERVSFDFVGNPGAKSWWKRQGERVIANLSRDGHEMKKIFGKITPAFEISNIMVDENLQLHIIDPELFEFTDNVPPIKRLTNVLAFRMNQLFMRHYFGLEIGNP